MPARIVGLKFLDVAVNLRGEYVMLEELLKKIENPDPALLHPADYTLPKE